MALEISTCSFHLGSPRLITTKVSGCNSRHLTARCGTPVAFSQPSSGRSLSQALRCRQSGTSARRRLHLIRVVAPEKPGGGTAQLPTGNKELIEELIEFLMEDAPNLFSEKGIDKSRYDENVDFQDPITQYDSISGYLFNIQMLRRLFNPLYELHSARQTAPHEITTRWTMTMTFWLLPWSPTIVFTGESIMGVNPDTGKFCSHVDVWDSIKNQKYFSVEGLKDLLTQAAVLAKTPQLEGPRYRVLIRNDKYEVRRYSPFTVLEGPLDVGEGLTGQKGFDNLVVYIRGQNARSEAFRMTIPVFTRKGMNEDNRPVTLGQIFLPVQPTQGSLPAPTQPGTQLREIPGGVAAVLRLPGAPTEAEVEGATERLRAALARDGLAARPGLLYARYNRPEVMDLVKRNEVILWLEDFDNSLFPL